MITIKQVVRHYLTLKKMNVADLAKATGCKYSEISYIVNGRRKTKRVAILISKTLGIDTELFLNLLGHTQEIDSGKLKNRAKKYFAQIVK